MDNKRDFDHAWFLLGQRVRSRRLKLGLENQSLLAAKGNLTRASIHAIERGKQPPSIRTLFVLADVLKCDPGDLLPTMKELAGNQSAEQIVAKILKGEENGQED